MRRALLRCTELLAAFFGDQEGGYFLMRSFVPFFNCTGPEGWEVKMDFLHHLAGGTGGRDSYG